MTIPAPCIECQEVADLTKSRCADCYRAKRADEDRVRYARHGRRVRPEREKQASAWRRLSKRARALQPFCSDCHRTADQLEESNELECDHLPRAFHRLLSGLPVRLSDVDVVCAEDNRKRGSALPGSDRYEQWAAENNIEPLVSADV